MQDQGKRGWQTAGRGNGRPCSDSGVRPAAKPVPVPVLAICLEEGYGEARDVSSPLSKTQRLTGREGREVGGKQAKCVGGEMADDVGVSQDGGAREGQEAESGSGAGVEGEEGMDGVGYKELTS